MVAWFLTIVLVYLFGRWIVTLLIGPVSGVGVFVLVVAAIFLAQPLAHWGERKLVALWPSGRAVQLESGALTWRDKSQSARLDLRGKVNYWRWRFQVRRRRGGRVPSGHHCFAIRLLQGDTAVSLYTFLPSERAEALATHYAFYELRRPNDTNKLLHGGRDAVYLAAEDARWESGAELEAADFEALLLHLAAHVPEFARLPAS